MPSTNTDSFAIADRLGDCIGRKDVNGIGQLYADNVVVWHNYDEIEQSKEENLATLRAAAEAFASLRYNDIRRLATASGFVQQHNVVALLPRGEVIKFPVCMIVTIHDGRITRLEEYLSPPAALSSQLLSK